MSLRKQITKTERVINKIFDSLNIGENAHINQEDYPKVMAIIRESGMNPEYILRILRINL